MWCIIFKCVIMVIGVIEWYIFFVNNDRLGIMLVGVMWVYVNCWVVMLMCKDIDKIVIFINGDDGYCIVFDLIINGVFVLGVVDICKDVLCFGDY